MAHFPMFVDLQDRPVLLVGGGTVALRKARKLAPYGVRPTVVAPKILPAFSEIPHMQLRPRSFRASDLRPRPALVIAAADDPAVNRRVSRLCRQRQIPVNVADSPALCTFLFPALVQSGRFSAGVSTGGASPAAAVWGKELLQEQLPENLDELLAWLENRRPALKAAMPDPALRSAAMNRLWDAALAKGAPLTDAETARVLDGQPLGSVALVGAGCGKADLITVRGLRLLRRCQAVVYDDLIDPALLDAAPESARRIYMGKRSGAHAAPQEEINRTLIDLAREGLQVVRLKGGDPYLFGRGGEELLALQAAGIPCREVPGIPSAMGIPAEAGIPVTHRGVSRGLHIVTAHTADTPDGLPDDFDTLAGLSGTLVFLMGLGQLPAITARLLAAGKAPGTPCAVLSGGNAPHPLRVRAPLSRLAQAAKEAGAASPAVILVGDVAAMDLSAPPLRGLKIGLTGTPRIAEKQRRLLQALGAEAFWVMRSDVKDLPENLPLSFPEGRRCWLVFTSANGVESFFRQAAGQPLPPERCRFAVIGAATGEALARRGIRYDLCPDTFTGEALAAALAAAAQPDEKILLLRSAQATDALPRLLREAALSPEEHAIYDVTGAACADPLPRLDYLTFSSAGGVGLFFQQYGALPEDARCVCIGSTTAQALAQHMDRPFLTAPEISANGIVEAILQDRQKTAKK